MYTYIILLSWLHLTFIILYCVRHVGRLNISEVYLAGVSDALSQNKDGDTKGIKAHFRMDESGILNLDYVSTVTISVYTCTCACLCALLQYVYRMQS